MMQVLVKMIFIHRAVCVRQITAGSSNYRLRNYFCMRVTSLTPVINC